MQSSFQLRGCGSVVLKAAKGETYYFSSKTSSGSPKLAVDAALRNVKIVDATAKMAFATAKFAQAIEKAESDAAKIKKLKDHGVEAL
jgi:hypothetical protein